VGLCGSLARVHARMINPGNHCDQYMNQESWNPVGIFMSLWSEVLDRKVEGWGAWQVEIRDAKVITFRDFENRPCASLCT